jgi:hypothetical protein
VIAMRTSQQVAERAIVMTTLAFRSSLEVTDHPRSIELTNRLLGWLESYRLDFSLEPTQREILAAPRGTLTRSQMSEAVWCAEEAGWLAWAIGHGEPLPTLEPADARPLVQTLHILQDEVERIVEAADFRPRSEIENTGVEILLTLCELRARRASDPNMLRQFEMGRIIKLGLSPTDEAVLRVRDFVDSLPNSKNQPISGMYFVRSIAVRWLFDNQ